MCKCTTAAKKINKDKSEAKLTRMFAFDVITEIALHICSWDVEMRASMLRTLSLGVYAM